MEKESQRSDRIHSLIRKMKTESNTGYFLYPFQWKWILDESDYKIANKARQVGFSFILSLEALLESFLTGNNSLIASASLVQADELMAKVIDHFQALKGVYPDLEGQETKRKLIFPRLLKNGKLSKTTTQIKVVTSSYRTARSFTGNIFLDEFAFHQDSDAVYTALLPSLSRKDKNLKMRIISTPAGKKGRFYSLFSDPDNDYRKYEYYIDDAIKEGQPFDKMKLKANMTVDEFKQEFCGVFLDENYSFYPLSLVESCIIDSKDIFSDAKAPYYMGVDIGRVKDKTVLFLAQKIEGRLIHKDIMTLSNLDFQSQEAEIVRWIERYNVRLCKIDSTGIGFNISENLKRQYGSRIDAVHFTGKLKERWVSALKIGMQDGNVKLLGHKELISAIHSIERTLTSSGGVAYEGKTKDGHADEFWALALCYSASNHDFTDYNIITGNDGYTNKYKNTTGGLHGYRS